jgi:hypothetical protein
MKLSWPQLVEAVDAHSVGGDYIAYYRSKHISIGKIVDGTPVMSATGLELAERLGTEEAVVVTAEPRQVPAAPIGITAVDATPPVPLRRKPTRNLG